MGTVRARTGAPLLLPARSGAAELIAGISVAQPSMRLALIPVSSSNAPISRNTPATR